MVPFVVSHLGIFSFIFFVRKKHVAIFFFYHAYNFGELVVGEVLKCRGVSLARLFHSFFLCFLCFFGNDLMVAGLRTAVEVHTARSEGAGPRRTRHSGARLAFPAHDSGECSIGGKLGCLMQAIYIPERIAYWHLYLGNRV